MAASLGKSGPKNAAPFHIPSLDGIRAISFLIVFLGHAGLRGIIPSYFGLSVFFFLSGYLITTLMRLEFDRTGDISFKQFYVRRALRILPPFYLILLVAYGFSALGVWHGAELTSTAVLAQVFHLTNYYIIRHGWWEGLAPGTWVYWSLAVEEHFYVAFPFLYLWMRRKSRSEREQAWLLLGICAVVLVWRCVLVFALDAARDRTYVASDTRIDSILAGCLLAVWCNPVLSQNAPSDRVLKRYWLPLGFLAVAVSLVIRTPAFEQTLRYTLQSFGLLPFFLAAIRWHEHGVFRLLNQRVLKYLGLLSYSMYLLHTSTLWAIEQWTPFPEWLRAAVGLSFLVVVATLIHRFVEKPISRLRRRFAH
jgi:peptidoglycan/LPS O-acetylase OafA/YrhL